jgi:K+-transporting ATPase ATPase A chain
MTTNGYLQLAFYVVVLLALAKPLGSYMARVYQGERTFLAPVIRPVEGLIYRAAGISAEAESDWKKYAFGLLLFNIAGLIVVYALQRLQAVLPLNPQGLAAVTAHSSWNTAVSFATNTNWQGYGGEVTMSYLTQMAGLTVQNFVSAAAGMAVMVALIRGISRHTARTIGSFWIDLTRSVLYILPPGLRALVGARVAGGRPDPEAVRLGDSRPADSRRRWHAGHGAGPGGRSGRLADRHQAAGDKWRRVLQCQLVSPFRERDPVLQLPRDVVDSAHPGGARLYLREDGGRPAPGVGVADGDDGHLRSVAGAGGDIGAGREPFVHDVGRRPAGERSSAGWKHEEARFGIANSALWATATTAASNGSVNSMHDSFTPLGGLVPIWMMQLGEIIYGGVGSGLYGMLAFVIVAVFVAGLMVGRTPEYLGKKIEAYEMKMASLLILIPVLLVLGGTAIAAISPTGQATVWNPGAHGFSEIFAFSSAGNNNGSAFAGLGANTPFYNTALGFAMLFARYWLAIPALAIAGSLARKKKVPAGAGTLPTHTPLFVAWLIAVILIVGALSFLPALSLGPIVEHLLVG